MGRIPWPGGTARAAASPTAETAPHTAAKRSAGERAGPVCDPLLRSRLSGDGRQKWHAVAACLARRCSRAATVSAGTGAPGRISCTAHSCTGTDADATAAPAGTAR